LTRKRAAEHDRGDDAAIEAHWRYGDAAQRS
jgi:hypothetical protein